MGMGFGQNLENFDVKIETHPHPSPPLEREGIFNSALTCVGINALKGREPSVYAD